MRRLEQRVYKAHLGGLIPPPLAVFYTRKFVHLPEFCYVMNAVVMNCSNLYCFSKILPIMQSIHWLK
jgi:hypothetical protein